MSTLRPLLSISILTLASLAFAQTRVGGRPPTSGSSAPRNPAATPSAPSSPSVAGGVPLHTADQEGKVEFRTQTILIQVPVVITDKSGNHIHGLGKNDFQVLENGKEQKVSTFEEIVATHGKLPAVTPKPGSTAI
jgi:hypothetical protein